MRDYDCEVLIIGLGPVGLTLAAILGRMGLSIIAVERGELIYPLPRAAHVDHEIMRIFQSMNIIDAIMPHMRVAPDYEFQNAAGDVLMRFERLGVIGSCGWPLGFNIYQPGIENALRDCVAQLPNVATRYGVAFAAIAANHSDGAIITVATAGQLKDITARFIVACDGASSPVREACGISLDDYSFNEPWLVIDAKSPDESQFPTSNIQLCDPDRPTSFIHMGPGRLRWEFMLKPGEDPQWMKTDEVIEELLTPWRVLGDMAVERAAIYRFHGLVAQEWRKGSVFLVGDAAHQMPPFMGQGLCSGLRDAANLAWKLEAVINGEAGDALLATYQCEREAHVRFVIDRAIEMGRMVCTIDRDLAARRDKDMLALPIARPPVALPGLVKGYLVDRTPAAGELFPQPCTPVGLRLDDLLGAGAWLIVDGGTPDAALATGLRVVNVDSDLPPTLASYIKTWLAERDVEAVLVRPDRYVFGTGTAAALLDHYLSWRPQLTEAEA